MNTVVNRTRPVLLSTFLTQGEGINQFRVDLIDQAKLSTIILGLIEKTSRFETSEPLIVFTRDENFYKLKVAKPPLLFTYEDNYIFKAQANFKKQLNPFGLFSCTPSTRGVVDLNADDFARESEAFFQDLNQERNVRFGYQTPLKLNQWLTYLVNVVVDCPVGESGTVVIKHSPTPSFPLFHKKYNLTLEMKSLPPEILKLSEFSIKLVDEQGVKLVLNKKEPVWHFLFIN
jgi:hypothetical protein